MKFFQFIFRNMIVLIALFYAFNSTATPFSNIEETRSFNVKVVGKGQPMILIHGLNSESSVWDETVERYKKQFECHIVQIKGFAGTPAFDYGDELLAKVKDDLINYIKDKQLSDVILTGHSMGGFLSLWTASEAGDVVAGCIIVDSLPFMPAMVNPQATEENMMAMAGQMRTQMAAQTPETIKTTAPMYLAPMVTGEEKLQILIDWSVKSDQKASAQAMYELFVTDLRQEIANIKAPVLVLAAWIGSKNYGLTHESTAAGYNAQYANVGECDIQITDEGKHFIMWDDKEFYFSHLDRFLGQNLSSNR